MKDNKGAIILFVSAYVIVPLIFGGNNYVMSLFVTSLTVGGVALAWAMLGNLGGMVSFGHSAFFGVGMYVSALLAIRVDMFVPLAILLSGVGTMIASVLMMPVLRLRGPYFALAILAYAFIFKIIATQWTSMTGGSGGLGSVPRLPVLAGIDFSSRLGSYFFMLTILMVFAVCYALLRASHYGIALRAMHDSEDATRVVGVNSVLLKALMLLVSAFMTGVAGGFNAHYIGFVEPDYAFSTAWVTLPLVAAIFGGYRTILGPLVGALAVYMVDQLIFKNLIPSGHQLILGVLLVGMIILSPRGLIPLMRQFFRKRHAAA